MQYVCVYESVSVCVCVCACACNTCMCVYASVSVCVCVCVCAWVCLCVCDHAGVQGLTSVARTSGSKAKSRARPSQIP